MTTNMVATLFSARQELNGTADIIISYTDIVYGFQTVQRLLESTNPFNVIVDRNWRNLWEGRMEVRRK